MEFYLYILIEEGYMHAWRIVFAVDLFPWKYNSGAPIDLGTIKVTKLLLRYDITMITCIRSIGRNSQHAHTVYTRVYVQRSAKVCTQAGGLPIEYCIGAAGWQLLLYFGTMGHDAVANFGGSRLQPPRDGNQPDVYVLCLRVYWWLHSRFPLQPSVVFVILFSHLSILSL